MARSPFIIAIDGPAASGKSSAAQRVADHFGFLMVSTGAMYRAFTWHVLREGVEPADPEAVIALLQRTEFTCGVRDRQSTIEVNGADPGDELRVEDVNAAVSTISAIPEVRERLVEEQRRYAGLGSLVMEGRDIGTVVFPETPFKVYLDATAEVRARRRRLQGTRDDIRGRDRVDSTRKTAPLKAAEDAWVIDTSYSTLDEVVGEVIRLLRAAGVHSESRQVIPRIRISTLHGLGHALSRLVFDLIYRAEAFGLEHTRFPGGAILAANHVSFLDPPLIGSRLREPIYYLARKSLMGNRFAAWLLPRIHSIPVDQEKSDLTSLRESLRVVREGKKLLLFPEGSRSFDGNLQPPLRGVGLLIAKSGVPVIPVRVFGAHEVFPRGTKFPRLHGKLRVVFGEPIRFSAEELATKGKGGTLEVAEQVMEAIGQLEVPGEPQS